MAHPSPNARGRFHVGPNGPGPCHARSGAAQGKGRGCPYQNDPHYDSWGEANKEYNRRLRAEHGGNLPTPTRKPRRAPREETVRGEPVFKFHKDLGFPPALKVDKYRHVKVDLVWGHHALQAAEQEEYGEVKRLQKLDASQWDLIEVKARKTDLKVMRLLYRSQPDTQGISQCFVLEMEPDPRKPWKVVTVWKNEGWDDHASLDTSRYTTPDAVELTVPRAQPPQQPRETPPVPHATPPRPRREGSPGAQKPTSPPSRVAAPKPSAVFPRKPGAPGAVPKPSHLASPGTKEGKPPPKPAPPRAR